MKASFIYHLFFLLFLSLRWLSEVSAAPVGIPYSDDVLVLESRQPAPAGKAAPKAAAPASKAPPKAVAPASKSSVQNTALLKDAADFMKWMTTNVPKHQVMFYSGRTKINGKFVTAHEKMSEFEKKFKVSSLVTLMVKAGLPAYPPAWRQSPEWDEVSRGLAATSSGVVRVLLGRDVIESSVWHRIEHNTLKANKKVSGIELYVLKEDGTFAPLFKAKI
ncbi:hypothetical protein EST38_g7709 [Candolleomyces aberdarensis]|uniref:Uncharacterized protein n=1 Tax=Candolleomyces aberdarensis TaxID=2316362 RepID=A0A4V1Q3C9_9AGAR|nr:hypothetical protein EST38_g7709 [Candolleomyces aberdarensis]